MDDLILYVLGAFGVLVFGLFNMRKKLKNEQAKNSMNVTTVKAEKLDSDFKRAQASSKALDKTPIVPSTEKDEEFWNKRLK